jgi:hypothetical protein
LFGLNYPESIYGGTMRYLILILLLAISLAGVTLSKTPAKLADNAQLSAMFDADQSERRDWHVKKIDSDTLFKNDEKRRSEAMRLLTTGQVRTAADFHYAAFLFHHGHTIDDYRLATSLAWIGMTIDPANKDFAYLTASTWDRFMMEQGKPQWYGTKCRHEIDTSGKQELYPVDEKAVTDSDRARFDLKPLEVMRTHTGESIRLSGVDATC